MPKIYGYFRVSTSQKAEKQDYERQKYLFEQSGIHFNAIYEEHISGGVKGTQRQEFNKMLEVLKPEDTVCFTETSRFGRNYIDCFEMLDLITQEKKCNVKFLSNGFELKFSEKMNPYEWLTISNFFIMDEFQKRLIGYNTKNALAQKKKNGVKLGRKSIIDNETKAQIRISYQCGRTMREIANKFNIAKTTVCKIVNEKG